MGVARANSQTGQRKETMSDTKPERSVRISWWLMLGAWAFSQPATGFDLTIGEKIGALFVVASLLVLVVPNLWRAGKQED